MKFLTWRARCSQMFNQEFEHYIDRLEVIVLIVLSDGDGQELWRHRQSAARTSFQVYVSQSSPPHGSPPCMMR